MHCHLTTTENAAVEAFVLNLFPTCRTCVIFSVVFVLILEQADPRPMDHSGPKANQPTQAFWVMAAFHNVCLSLMTVGQ